MEIPPSVSGRQVTRRGVHLQPFGYHDFCMQEVDYWCDLLVSMGVSWVLALSESDSLFLSGAAQALLEAGVIPIVRFGYQSTPGMAGPLKSCMEGKSRSSKP